MTGTRIDPRTLAGRPCSIASALELVGDRWALLAVREIGFGNHQFGQIARNTGAPTDRLTARLKGLVAAGVLERRPNPDNPRFQGYHLTRAGRELAPVIRELLRWGDRWAVTEPPQKLWHTVPGDPHGDHELDSVAHCRTCGREVGTGEVRAEFLDPDWDLSGPTDA
ncbi:winged helix-turn-helix transcriptional regulator [Actinacidiphila guanduensis]|uniref:Transcriptional regulator, HxlR family n=1 Tax=Actinacidiphila guanduensis TaxID=310781 RepID=A0A1H0JY78_9ACTN|nr:helix-turn-helix domain-containing protein [Actinacidiphila guanduensis]SDO48443.1 transcriptional regulator, HxlR family [Actinacidiphila guanduensis]